MSTAHERRERQKTKQLIDEVANQIENRLLDEGLIIHRYNAKSGSVYLKLDYGQAYSIRVSDHLSKRHLAYKFNVLLTSPRGMRGTKSWSDTLDGKTRHFWTRHALNGAIAYILACRRNRLNDDPYGYTHRMELEKAKLESDTANVSRFYMHPDSHEVKRVGGKKTRIPLGRWQRVNNRKDPS